jgi:hypothetical protein
MAIPPKLLEELMADPICAASVFHLPSGEVDLADLVAEASSAVAFERQAGDLAMLVRQLVYALHRANPEHPVADRAMEYLQRHGLQGSITRDDLKTWILCPNAAATVGGPDGTRD